MPIAFNCPSCSAFTEVADHFAGQSGPCKSCGATITIPSIGPQPVSYPAPVKPKASSGGNVIIVLAIVLIGFVVMGGVLAALLLPAVQAAREASRRMACANQLKQIGLAMHNYHDVYGAFPPAYTVDEEGNRLHSWRTLLLPFIEQAPLYDQIDLSKPWDAPENRELANTNIPLFSCPSHPDDGAPHCNYMAIVGDGALFSGEVPTKISEILDGTSNTIMVVEVRENHQSWMEPTDLTFDGSTIAINSTPDNPGSYHPGGVQILLADGAVRFLAATVDRQVLKNLITSRGGEMVGQY